MYNRYTRNDNGVYTRMPQGEPSPSGGESRPRGTMPNSPRNPQETIPSKPPNGLQNGLPNGLPNGLHSPAPEAAEAQQKPPPPQRPERDLLNRILEKLHLGDLDAGDLLVLLLLFMLFRENADEELLIALGLLLIL